MMELRASNSGDHKKNCAARQGQMSFKIILFGRIITTITDYPKKVKVDLKWYIITANNGFGKKPMAASGKWQM